jgi:glycerophosphoryl diester phosphodiesterase
MMAAGYGQGRPLVIAHRGACDVAPENTLAAFEAAVQAGADGIELDVTRCASGEIVVIHDDTVDRTTNGSGRVAELPLGALRELDAGTWFDASFARQRIPLLSEVLDSVGSRLRMINIEIKGMRFGGDGIEAEIAELVRQRGLEQRVLISSFNPLALWRMRRAARGLACALLYFSAAQTPVARWLVLNLLRPQAVHPQYKMVNGAYMAWARARKLCVNVWTVNEATHMRAMSELGVDGIITNHPGALRQLLDG